MQQGRPFTMTVKIENVSVGDIEGLEFLFKLTPSPAAELLKRAVYPGDVLRSNTEENTFYIPWSAEETYQVPSDRTLYMETLVHIRGMHDIPDTGITRLHMGATLKGEGD